MKLLLSLSPFSLLVFTDLMSVVTYKLETTSSSVTFSLLIFPYLILVRGDNSSWMENKAKFIRSARNRKRKRFESTMEGHYRASSCHPSSQDDCASPKNETIHDEKSIVDYFLHQWDFQKRIRQSMNETHTNLHIMQETMTESFPPMPPSRISANVEKIKSMFEHAYDSYMYNAYPASELKPISCKGGLFDLVRLPALTLIDTLDMLLIMENHTEFARSVERLRSLDEEMRIKSIWKNGVERGGLFAQDQNVSVFETNIRVLGGLLSAHQMAEIWMDDKVLLENVFGNDGNVLMGSSDSSSTTSGSTSVAKCEVESSQNHYNDDDNEKSITDIHATSTPFCANQKGAQTSMCSNASEQVPCENINRDSIHGGETYNYDSGERTSSSLSNNGTSSSSEYWVYDGFLLDLAQDIGTRLLPAFNTRTGIPYGTVNLLHGVPKGETTIASLAGGGTLTLEMELLSRLTKDEKFGKLARLSARALFSRRSGLDLLGKHINVADGKWTETLSGIGSNSDSFYEYLIKDYILFPEDEDFFAMFNATYNGIYNNDRLGDWYPDVTMKDGLLHPHAVFESLASFYPGMQVLLGELNPAARSTNAFTLVREFTQFLPERFDFAQFQGFDNHRTYPLRPELYESNYFLHLATKELGYSSSSGWMWNADFFLNELEDSVKTRCGYAAIKGISSVPNQETLTTFDEMPSFFLSETLKYLYLTFNSDNPIDSDKDRSWIFTTEAHPLHSISAVKTSNSWLQEARSEILGTLDLLIKSAPIPTTNGQNEQSLNYLYRELWAPYTGKFSHIKDLRQISAKSKLFHVKNGSNSGSYIGRLISIGSQRIEGDPFSTNILNFGFLSHHIHGRGSRLSKSCPNYHQSNSLWMQALVGEEIDYAYAFETTFSNDQRITSIRSKIPSALMASTLLGTNYLSYDGNVCKISSSRGGSKEQEHKGAPGQRVGSKIVDVDDLGAFEISVSPSGIGYYIKHITSGESIEITIFQLESILHESNKEFVAIDSFILAEAELNRRNSVMNQFKAFFKIKSPTNSAKNRHVVVSDVVGHAFECKIELRFSLSGSMENISTTVFPCLPASYGPTSLDALAFGDKSGVQFDAKIYIPDPTDPFGCDEDWTGISNYDLNAIDGETKHLQGLASDFKSTLHRREDVCLQPFDLPRVQMVHRGMCNFHAKGINVKNRFNAGAVIVINSDPNDLFMMSGTGMENRKDINVDEPLSVLVSGEDGKHMIKAIQRYNAHGTDVLASVRITPKTSSLTAADPEISVPHDAIDRIDWPIVLTAPRSIQVYASQGWGIGAIKDDKNNQWQLTLLQHSYGTKLRSV